MHQTSQDVDVQRENQRQIGAFGDLRQNRQIVADDERLAGPKSTVMGPAVVRFLPRRIRQMTGL